MTQGFRQHGPNCGITALAIFLRLPFEEVWETYKRLNDKRGHWQGRSTERGRQRVLDHYGVAVEIKDLNGTIRLWNVAERTEILDSRKIVMVETTGHVQIVARGHIFDQTTNGMCHWHTFWGRNKLVERVITRKEDEA